MVKKRLTLEPEVQEIFQCIDNKRNFLLSGGAGSGKTYSLVQVIRQVIVEKPTCKVACITYTNAAVKEIEERVNHKNLDVSTIHNFLWSTIKHFQKELKSSVIALANDGEIKTSPDEEHPMPTNYFDDRGIKIQYHEYLKLREGIISHDELLIVANYMFKEHSKLSDIVKDKYQFIFIDEYQDTSTAVVEILLSHFRKSKKQNLVGFFGDAMQSIYDDGIGNLDKYKGEDADTVHEIKKTLNRRNPMKVIDLANRLRTDGITQEPSSDEKAPNMLANKVKEGKILFIYSDNDDISVLQVKDYLSASYRWNFEDVEETKELNLTYNLIADKAGFRELMNIYDRDPVISLKDTILNKIKDNKKKGKAEIEINETDSFDIVVDRFQLKDRNRQLKKTILLQDNASAQLYNQLKDKLFSEVRKIYLNKDSLIDDKKQNEDDESKKNSKRDNLIKHLFKIQKNIALYKSGRYNEFLRVTDYRITRLADKQLLKEKIENLINVVDKTIEEVISDAHEKGICLIDDNLKNFKAKNEYLYNRVKEVRFREFQKLYDYLEGRTPFSTQHKIKGTEFDNVLVILDNGRWNEYNFELLFTNSTDKARILERTQKIFYVCCTRAKENLAVFFHNPSRIVIAKATEWFGNENIVRI